MAERTILATYSSARGGLIGASLVVVVNSASAHGLCQQSSGGSKEAWYIRVQWLVTERTVKRMIMSHFTLMAMVIQTSTRSYIKYRREALPPHEAIKVSLCQNRIMLYLK